MDVVVPWRELEALIEPHYPKAGNGRHPEEAEVREVSPAAAIFVTGKIELPSGNRLHVSPDAGRDLG